MKKIVETLKDLEKEIAAEKGGFALFALFEREDMQGKWDLVISASWFGENKKEIIRFIVNKIKSRLTTKDMAEFSRVVLLDPVDAFVVNVNSVIQAEHTDAEFADCIFNGIPIKHAYVFTSKRIA
jgi:hypothetical protein